MGHPLHTALSGISPFQVGVFFAFSAGTWIRPLSSSLSSFLLSFSPPCPLFSPSPRRPLLFPSLSSSFSLPAVQVRVFSAIFAGTWMGHPLYTALSGISPFQVRAFFFLFAGTWIRPLSSSLSSFLSHHPSPPSFSLSLLPVLSSLPLPAVLSSFLLSLRPFLSQPSRSEYFQPFLLGPGWVIPSTQPSVASPLSRSEYFPSFLLGPGLGLSPHPSPLSSFLSHHPSPPSFSLSFFSPLPVLSSFPLPAVLSSFLLSLRPFLSPVQVGVVFLLFFPTWIPEVLFQREDVKNHHRYRGKD